MSQVIKGEMSNIIYQKSMNENQKLYYSSETNPCLLLFPILYHQTIFSFIYITQIYLLMLFSHISSCAQSLYSLLFLPQPYYFFSHINTHCVFFSLFSTISEIDYYKLDTHLRSDYLCYFARLWSLYVYYCQGFFQHSIQQTNSINMLTL